MKKTQEDILKKLKIEALNPMQVEAIATIKEHDSVVLLSPTGTGKTLAFLLPLLDRLDPECKEVQAVIIAPSRELVIQIQQVLIQMGTGYKVNAVYGGKTISMDKRELKHLPAIIIGTPGRLSDHLTREHFSTVNINTIVLDEFDKCLQAGFDNEMADIMETLPHLEKRILTSATHSIEIPPFVSLDDPVSVDYLHEEIKALELKVINSKQKDKTETLITALSYIGNKPGIIFCNYKETIKYVSDFLKRKNIPHGTFYGEMEQIDRERALVKFRNGSHQLLVATDLAARGIDIPEIEFILHYQLPKRTKEFTHRNGRTARMGKEGVAYILKWEKESLPPFVKHAPVEKIQKSPLPIAPPWATLFISGGRKDKISKGDIAGLLMKEGMLSKEDVGLIEIMPECSFVAVKKEKSEEAVDRLDGSKLKKKKVRISLI